MELLPISKRVYAKTIASELISVIPMGYDTIPINWAENR